MPLRLPREAGDDHPERPVASVSGLRPTTRSTARPAGSRRFDGTAFRAVFFFGWVLATPRETVYTVLARRGREELGMMTFDKATYDTLKSFGEAMKISEWFPLDGKVDASKAVSDVRTEFSVSKETAKAVLVSWGMKDGGTVEAWVPKAAFEEAPFEVTLRREVAGWKADGASDADVAERLRNSAKALREGEIREWEMRLEGIADLKGKQNDDYYDSRGAFHKRTINWDWSRRFYKDRIAEFKERAAVAEKIAEEIETQAGKRR